MPAGDCMALHDPETAMVSLVRALEAFAQRQLFKHYQIKTWDVQPEQLPQALQETCRSCWLEDLDGKYKLPLQAQFRALAGLGDQMGQAFLREWPTMKPLLDAANHAVLGHGFRPGQSRTGAAAVRCGRQAIGRQRNVIAEVSGAEPLAVRHESSHVR